MKTNEQTIAGNVYERVADFGKRYPKDSLERKKYGSMAQTLPILVLTAGLAEALAFAESRSKSPINDLLDHLAQTISFRDRTQLISQSRQAGLQDYIYLTRQSMLALKWFKRFSQSILDVEITDVADERGA